MPPVGFEPKVSAGELPQTCALDRAATGTGSVSLKAFKLIVSNVTLAFPNCHDTQI